MTIEQQLQKVIHETNILREMISIFPIGVILTLNGHCTILTKA